MEDDENKDGEEVNVADDCRNDKDKEMDDDEECDEDEDEEGDEGMLTLQTERWPRVV